MHHGHWASKTSFYHQRRLNEIWRASKPANLHHSLQENRSKRNSVVREPWSSGYGRRLTFQRSWVWFPAPDTGWTWHFFTLICYKNCIVCLKKTENKRKRGRGWAIFLKKKEIAFWLTKKFGTGRGDGQVVSVLPFYSADPSLNPDEIFFVNNENKQKEEGLAL